MTKAIKQAGKAMKAIERMAQVLFVTFAVAIVTLASSYVYFVNQSVFNTVAREKTESNMMALQTKLGQAEKEYMNSLNDLTLDKAESMGFVSATGKVLFVSAQTVPANVAMR